MILSRGRRYIFLHPPKTGGTALTLALEARAMKDDIIVADTPKGKARARRQKGLPARGRLWKHSTLADLDGLVTDAELEDLLIFTLVRNPWDRVVSYYHWLREQPFRHPAVARAKALDFSKFLNSVETVAELRAQSYADFVTDAQGQEREALFIRFESMEEGLSRLEAHLGFRPGPLPRVNVSARDPDWRRYYSDREAEIVARISAADIEKFNYRF